MCKYRKKFCKLKNEHIVSNSNSSQGDRKLAAGCIPPELAPGVLGLDRRANMALEIHEEVGHVYLPLLKVKVPQENSG